MKYPKNERIMNVNKTAEYFGVCRQTIYRWIEEGRIKPTSIIGKKKGFAFTVESLKQQEKKYM